MTGSFDLPPEGVDHHRRNEVLTTLTDLLGEKYGHSSTTTVGGARRLLSIV